jgi:hypothetical protein
MDETTKTKQDNSSGKETPSAGKPGTTSKDTEPQTFTEDQATKMVSDALAKAGRDAKTLTDREAAVKAQEDANKAEQERKDAAELAKVQGDPDKLAAYQAKKAEADRAKDLTEGEANLARDKADHEAELTASRETQKEITIFEIASAKSIDPVRLKNLSEKFNVEGKEKLEELAGEIASGKETDPDFNPDSGLTKGVKQDWHELSPDEKIRRGTTSKK